MVDYEHDEGFIYVASLLPLYYEFAIISAETLKDNYPKAHVTLFTHENFVDERASIFDKVVTEIPIHKRAKMWCMARTPYKKTFYNDVDSQIVSRKIKNVFSELDDCDMFFTKSFWYTTADHRWAFFDKNEKIPVEYHGAVCGYNKTEATVDFFNTWFEEYHKQNYSRGWPYDFAYPQWKQFDMFTLWRLTSGRFSEFDRFKALNIKMGPKIYNATIHDNPKEYSNKKPIVYQIDKTSYESMGNTWSKIQENLKNAKDFDQKYKATKDLIQYN